MMKRSEVLKALAKQRKDEAVVYTMSSFNDWSICSNGPLDFFLGGGMSFASSIGLGIALAQPRRRVWVIDGDGSLLMNLGSLVTIAGQSPHNLYHFVLDNGVYEVPGCVPLPGLGRANFPAFAEAAGFNRAYEYSDLVEFEKDINRVLKEQGPVLISLRVDPAPVAFAKDRMRGAAEMARDLKQSLSGAKG